MNDTINLETKTETPVGGETLAVPYGSSYCPEVTLSHPDLVNLPNEGKCVIDYEVVSRTHEKVNGECKCSVRIKIKSIRPMGRKRYANVSNQAERAMRDLLGEG